MFANVTLMSGSHRHRIGQDGPTKVNKVRNCGRNSRIFAVCYAEKSADYFWDPAVSNRISNFVDLFWSILSLILCCGGVNRAVILALCAAAQLCLMLIEWKLFNLSASLPEI